MVNKEPMTRDDQVSIGLLAGKAFSPGAPIKSKDVFAGRMRQLRQVIDAINQDGRGVLIYGERGVGKTSLANVIDEFYLSIANTRIFAPHISCDTEDTFASIWLKIIDEKDRERPTAGLSDTMHDEIDGIINQVDGNLTPHSIRSIADIIVQTHLFIPIIDEFDRIKDPYSISMFTDTIKSVSDHVLNTTILLVGVGDTVDDLVSDHSSVERALEQVLMPRMTPKESIEILSSGENSTGIRFDENASSLLVSIAKGLPHYIHSLGLHATREAVDSFSWIITEEHVEAAVSDAIDSSQRSLIQAYHSATTSPRSNSLFRQVLLACALANTDELGYFAAADVVEPLSKIMGQTYEIASFTQHLNSFSSEDRGNVLRKVGTSRRYRFRFRNPLLQPFVVMRGLGDGHIDKVNLRELLS